jgi:hypothetical protein
MLAFVFLGITFSGCQNYSEVSFEPEITDGAAVLKKETAAYLASKSYPQGFIFVVISRGSIDPVTVGVFADEQFEVVASNERLGDAFERRGVLFVVTRHPGLVQVRVGKDFYRQAQWSGLTMGSEYIKRQQLARTAGLDASLVSMVDWLAAELPTVEDIPWYRRMILNDSVQSLYMELQDLSLPSDGFYWTFLLKPVASLRSFERRMFGTWWMTFVVVGLLAYGLKWLLSLFLIAPLRALSRPVGTIVGLVVGLGVVFGLAIPSAGSAILLAGSRCEDQIALAAIGLPGVDELAFAPDFSTRRTTLGLALLLFVARVVKGFASRASALRYAFLPNEEQEERFERMAETDPAQGLLLSLVGQGAGQTVDIGEDRFLQRPFFWIYFRPGCEDLSAGLRWALLAWVFLPLSLSLAALYFWVVPISLGLWNSLKSLRSFQKRTTTARLAPS